MTSHSTEVHGTPAGHRTAAARRSTRSRRLAVAFVAMGSITLAACSSTNSASNTAGNGAGTTSTGSGSTAQQVTLTWWHNATSDPGKSVWQGVADAYHQAHPNVSFKVEPIQNEQFTTKVPLALQGSNPPDIYQQWGGGSEATQVQSGKLMDMTSALSGFVDQLGKAAKAYQVDGKWYGLPYDYHAVGFWYRKDLFAKAGITTPPKTMDELNADVTKLKNAGIVPVAVGGKDRWPDAFYWEYFAIRECSTDTVKQAIQNQKLDDPCFIKAGDNMKAFLATNPFQPGFNGTPAQQGAGSSAGLVANGKAAMELQGDWELAVMPSLTSDKSFASKLGWFPFPSVSGGKGDPANALGGGDGFSCTSKATAACPDFLKYIDSAAVQKKLVSTNTITVPANPAADSSITNAALKQVLQYLNSTPYLQMYFDQALPTNPGQALDSAIADFFAGKGTPKSVAQSVEQATD